MDDPTDEYLIAASASGDERAFGALYDRHVEPIYRHAVTELGDADDAQEVTQQVFATAWRKLRKINLVDGSARSWLLVTARNLTANRLRSARRRPVTASFDDPGLTIADAARFGDADRFDDLLSERELMTQLDAEVAVMPTLDQGVYRAVLEQGLSYEAASETLGISVASVRKRLHRVRTRLRKRLGATQ
ncbi:RNA polymerase sigma factor [Salinibacterium sp. ZJ450]|uniref:RNA polymerase sigma factor n=1 Tax=Salinibacterium sp. ZJ450 TaxID=2708338 RepID=UPI0014229AD7|nr:sigma-70 family RNA polymerase sigma factor [Salinibacterium sp. ZJ450]